MGSKEYYRGEVYLASHQDTVTLKRFGFRELEFVGRSLHGVKYAAMWPLDLPVDSLPEAVSGLDYLLDEKTSAAIEVPLEPDEQRQASRIDIPQRAAHEAYRRYVIRDLTEKDYSYSYITVPAETKRYKQYDYDKEDVDQATRGVFRVNPIEEGPFHTKEYVVTKDDPAIGTIRENPIEEGNFHTPQNVVTRDHPAVGTFHTRANPGASSLRPMDFGILKNYSNLQTGRTFFTTPSGGVQNWQRAVPNGRHPRTMSVDEWRRMHGGR